MDTRQPAGGAEQPSLPGQEAWAGKLRSLSSYGANISRHFKSERDLSHLLYLIVLSCCAHLLVVQVHHGNALPCYFAR